MVVVSNGLIRISEKQRLMDYNISYKALTDLNTAGLLRLAALQY
ncbi:hypothetical protein EV13_1040 [Prochlorococcus sp. MIT 0702]|nr:hypothetical protein EV12_1079 [Prochlorococcus sp. MIT 0701]KGG29573.1 hypothetical protein EV13_1040 [Prochlorococcus sp. MIT 0702]KGG36069.1 hypothetical protein EV14_0476 [Prochlorococcus sp. MIT 0703]